MMTHWLVPRGSARNLCDVRPFWRMRSELDEIFDDVWRGFGIRGTSGAGFTPRVDISETDEELRVTAELPGLDEKDFEVSLEDNVLTIKGERKEESEEKREGFRYMESSRGEFRRAIRLPFEADPEAVKARFKRGVLTVTLPKPPEGRPRVRTIPVSTS